MKNNKKTITVGLINGRHSLPVNKFIFENIENEFHYKTIEKTISEFIIKEVGLKTPGRGICISLPVDEAVGLDAIN